MEMIEICDTHNDFLTELKVDALPSYIKSCKESGVKVICASYWSTKRDRASIFYELEEKAKVMRENCDFLLHLEDLWWVFDENAFQFLNLINPFSCSLTWNGENPLACGTGSQGGLTKLGWKVANMLIERGTVIDFAHLNCQSFYQLSKLVKNNLYCSHTGFRGIKNAKRNLTDKQVETIVKSNGFIGLFFFDRCVKIGKGFSVFDIVENLKYFTNRWGFDNIGIGSDFYGIENYPNGLENYCDFLNLTQALMDAGFNKEQIEKLYHKNFEEFLNRTIQNLHSKKN